MDVLRPPVVWIDGRCYRKYPVTGSNQKEQCYRSEENSHQSQNVVWTEESFDVDVPIEETDDGQFKATLAIPSVFFKVIIGTKGLTKKRLENETTTKIIVPKQGMEGDIIIYGPQKCGVISARTRMELLVDSARKKTPFTHFLSLPLNQGPIQNGFLDFRDDVLRQCDGMRGIDASIFQNPQKLHLTIGTLVLLDKQERKLAGEILKQCEKEVVEPCLEGQPLDVTVEGIEYMNDDPAEVDVLYAQIQTTNHSNRLQRLANSLVDKYTSSGLMNKQFDSVKLHLTLMNTKFRTDISGESQNSPQRRRKPRETFDASYILQTFKNYHFGHTTISEVHLSQLHATDKDGYYACSAKLELPK
ncbi:activating signal cointegrator 1 complex subunit 1-like [Limulus polyphemus]|uniref:Activating signal cointegrator 1 complex subunit 1-like n=1 Tax=Limulus polyphemus TaxID=6850 RepID=A0ABM1BCC2_LIMPO|nr:activating signal cointegrator 1 complex subunit 1-like [Limulus polyphemus]